MEKIEIVIGATHVRLNGLGAIAITAAFILVCVALLIVGGGMTKLTGGAATTHIEQVARP